MSQLDDLDGRDALYQAHLDRVSRSFAICIQQLQQPLRRWTSLAYLLMRLLDTVEDSPWRDVGAQLRQYGQFDAFCTAPPTLGEVAAWSHVFTPGLPDGEKALLASAHVLLLDLHALPPSVRGCLQQALLRTSAGMQHYSAQARASRGTLRLGSLADVNRYCFFVAGLVGHLLTQLYGLAYQVETPPRALYRDAFHFGLFLQKVNLLKDQPRDEREGRFLVPHRPLVLASLRQHAGRAAAYIAQLAPEARPYRTFCGWSLFLGAASLPQIERAFADGTSPKLPRQQARALLAEVTELVQDNAAMHGAMAQLMALWPEAAGATEPADGGKDGPKVVSLEGQVTATQPAGHGPDAESVWFAEASGQILNAEELAELGLV